MPQLAVVLPLAGLESTLDGDQLALAQVLGADLSESVPGHDGVELGLLLAAAVLVGGDAELGRPLFELASARISGSRVRRPTSSTLFM